jgi:outer membrane immunogenic protein
VLTPYYHDQRRRRSLCARVAGLSFSADQGASLYYNYSKARPTIDVAYYDWSGFYFGLNGGGGSSRDCWDNVNTFGVPTIPTAAEGCRNASGAIAGGHLGYRWQSAFAVHARVTGPDSGFDLDQHKMFALASC